MAEVFLLWHQHPGDEEGKLLGVYSTKERAEARIVKARSLPGFRRFPSDFVIARYEVDLDQWLTGFATTNDDGGWVEDLEP